MQFRDILSPDDAILVKEDQAVAFTVAVDDPSAQADTDGNKFIEAGTWLNAPTDVLLGDRKQVMTPTTDASKAQGVLLHRANVNNGQVDGALVIAGVINRAMIETATKAKYYSDDQVHNLVKSLPKITVIDR